VAFVRFRKRTNSLLELRWHVLTLATLAGHLTVYLVLLVSLRVLGVTADEVTAVEAFAAWSFVRLLGSIPITPGGLGVVELGVTTAPRRLRGDQVDVVAAVPRLPRPDRGAYPPDRPPRGGDVEAPPAGLAPDGRGRLTASPAVRAHPDTNQRRSSSSSTSRTKIRESRNGFSVARLTEGTCPRPSSRT
jgi:hypothetical protein